MINMKLYYALFSAALMSSSAIAGDFHSLGALPTVAMEDSQLATVEGGFACGFNFFSGCATFQNIDQFAQTNQVNWAAASIGVIQSNGALTAQFANNSN